MNRRDPHVPVRCLDDSPYFWVFVGLVAGSVYVAGVCGLLP